MAKEFKKSSAEKLETTARALGINPAALAQRLGYSNGASNHWIKEGVMPFVASLACDSLLADLKAPDRFIFVSMRQGKPIESRVHQSLDEITIGGKKFLLVPIS